MPISPQTLEESIHRDGRGRRTLYLQDRIHYIESQTGQLEGTRSSTTKATISRIPLLVHIPRRSSQHRWESNDSVSANVDSNRLEPRRPRRRRTPKSVDHRYGPQAVSLLLHQSQTKRTQSINTPCLQLSDSTQPSQPFRPPTTRRKQETKTKDNRP